MGCEDAPVVYLRSASISALRSAVDKWAEGEKLAA